MTTDTPSAGARHVVARLFQGYAATLGVVAFLLIVLPKLGPRIGRAWGIADEALRGGAASLVFGSGLLAVVATAAALSMARARVSRPRVPRSDPDPLLRLRRPRVRLIRAEHAGDSARRVQGVLVPLLALAAAIAAGRLAPGPAAVFPVRADALAIGGALIVACFVALIAERFAASLSSRACPEQPALRAILLLPVLALAVGAACEFARAFGIGWTGYVVRSVGVILIVTAAELIVRALARWFLPPPPPERARAAIDSLTAALIAGLGRRDGMTAPLRAQTGLDFSRSWALRYLRGAALPASVLTVLLCWMLSGLALVPIDQRGVYERLGAPVAVLGPGLHLILPWPLGRLRPVELGVVHELAVGGDLPAAERADAEGLAPPGADRLWDGEHPGELAVLVASRSANGTQAFQTVSADIRVLYRVGGSDEDAMEFVYAAEDPPTLVRAAAGRLVTRFFAQRTLAELLGEQRETMASMLRAQLGADLAAAQTGLEIVAVTVEAVHPPSGAAAAYHGVQAAEITANASIAAETGRAKGTASFAAEQAHRMIDVAQASQAEAEQGASADALRFDADRAAHGIAGTAFLTERYYGNLAVALSRAPLTILDARVAASSGSVVDLRPLALPATSTPETDD